MINGSSISATVAGALVNGEREIPLHIIFVHDDTPPTPFGSIQKSVDYANDVFQGTFEFKICNYHYVNGGSLVNIDLPLQLSALQNLYHVNNAINVYIFKGLAISGGSAGGGAAFPWSVNFSNWIALDDSGLGGVPSILAHELGHYFGLYHTFNGMRPTGTSNCFIINPAADQTQTGDRITDTPIDPWPSFSTGCVETCPTYNCTVTCGSNTYTYNGIKTDNVMSYYDICTVRSLTPGQIEAVKKGASYPSRAFLFDSSLPTCNNLIADQGVLESYKYGLTRLTNGSIIVGSLNANKIKSVRVNIANNYFTGNDGESIVISQDRAGDFGKYDNYRVALANAAYATIRPVKTNPAQSGMRDNYRPDNGISSLDVALAQDHTLGIIQLPAPYNIIAADANNSGSVTSFDVSLIRSVFLYPTTSQFPAGTWRFIPEMYFSNTNFVNGLNSSNPFAATYLGKTYLGVNSFMDQVELDMDDNSAANPTNWGFRSIKVGDLDATANLNATGSNLNGEGVSSRTNESVLLETAVASKERCASQGDIISVTFDIQDKTPIRVGQLGISYDRNMLEILGSSEGNFPDYDPENFAFFPEEGIIRTLWFSKNGKKHDPKTNKQLFRLQFRVLKDFCTLDGLLKFDDQILNNFFLDDSSQPIQKSTIVVDYKAEKPTASLKKVFPNPATREVSFDFKMEETTNVSILLTDYNGKTLTHESQYPAGNHIYTFGDISSLAGNIVNYTVKMGTLHTAGVIIRKLD